MGFRGWEPAKARDSGIAPETRKLAAMMRCNIAWENI